MTPVTKLDLILGLNIAGAVKTILSGIVLITIGSLITGIPDPSNMVNLMRVLAQDSISALELSSV